MDTNLTGAEQRTTRLGARLRRANGPENHGLRENDEIPIPNDGGIDAKKSSGRKKTIRANPRYSRANQRHSKGGIGNNAWRWRARSQSARSSWRCISRRVLTKS